MRFWLGNDNAYEERSMKDKEPPYRVRFIFSNLARNRWSSCQRYKKMNRTP